MPTIHLRASYETAWMTLHKFRRAMINLSREPLQGDVEVDGAKPKMSPTAPRCFYTSMRTPGAQLSGPSGVTVDSAGNIYIADTVNYRVRKVSPTGVITTAAGNGEQAYSGDGGSPTSAGVGNSAGDLYITDVYNSRIRVVRTGTAAVSIITTSPLTQGTAGVAYSQTLSAAGGVAPYTWSVTSGALPGSLTLAGTPTTAGAYSFTAQARDSASAAASRDFQPTISAQPVNTPTIFAGGIVNAASNAAGQPITAGSVVSIYGANLATSTMQSSSIPLPISLNNVSVTFNSVPAPLVFVAPGQINAQVPWDVLPGVAQSGSAAVVVTSGGAASAPATVPVG